MMTAKQILIFHRNSLFRDCLASFLQRDRGHAAKSVNHLDTVAIADLIDEAADVLLVDLGLPNGMVIEIARSIRERGLNAKIIVLVPDDHEQLIECIAGGAHGCILERSSLETLDHAIATVIRGNTYCCPEIVGTMFKELSRVGHALAIQPPSESSEPRLTPREQEVLLLLDRRMSNKEIASELCVSLFTVKNHVRNILEKLDVDSRLDAPEKARRQYDLSRIAVPSRSE